MNLTVATVKAFYANEENLALVAKVLAARLVAEATREAVDAYIEPLFATYEFYADQLPCDSGRKLTSSRDLWLSKDDEQAAKFYAACDAAHAAHGWELPGPGYCPALMAENEVIEAENELLKAAAEHFGLPFDGMNGSLELRAQALDLFTSIPMAA